MKKNHKILIATIVLTFFVAAPAFAETKLIFNLFIPRTHNIFGGILEPWAKNVNKETQGRIKVQFTAASVAPVPRQFDAIKKGVADIGIDQHVFNPKRFVLPTIGSMPFASPTSEAASVALWRAHEKFFDPANEHKDVKLLSYLALGPSHLFTAKKHIKSVADVQGQKIRISARYAKDVADAFGFVMVGVPGPASYEVISKGTVDGTTFSFSDIYNFRISKFMKNVLVIPGGLYTATFSLIINQKKWDSLSKADQEGIVRVSGENFGRLGRAWDEADRVAWDKLRKAGIKASFIKKSEKKMLESKLTYIIEQWKQDADKRGVDGAAAYSYYREQVAQVAKGSWQPTP